jgi:hypothetical protein
MLNLVHPIEWSKLKEDVHSPGPYSLRNRQLKPVCKRYGERTGGGFWENSMFALKKMLPAGRC